MYFLIHYTNLTNLGTSLVTQVTTSKYYQIIYNSGQHRETVKSEIVMRSHTRGQSEQGKQIQQ